MSGVARHGGCAGYTKTPEYRSWALMIQRCGNPKNRWFHNYGGRGISVCDHWRKSFAAFLADIGKRPGKGFSLDRINNNGNYEPGNVKWADHVEQARNTRRNVIVAHDGRSMCISAWAAELGITHCAMKERLKRANVSDPFRKNRG